MLSTLTCNLQTRLDASTSILYDVGVRVVKDLTGLCVFAVQVVGCIGHYEVALKQNKTLTKKNYMGIIKISFSV